MAVKRKFISEFDLKEFRQERAAIFKTRIFILCFMALALHISTSLVGFILDPSEFLIEELWIWVFLIGTMIIVLFLNSKSFYFFEAKRNAYLFSIALIFTGIATFLIYPACIAYSSFMFIIILFSVCFILPWSTFDVVVLFILSIGAYVFNYWWAKQLPLDLIKAPFNPATFRDDLIMLAIAFVVCFVARKKDNDHDIDLFNMIRQIKRNNEQLEKDLELARDVHKSLIPKSISTDLADIVVNYLPMHYVGGDYVKFHFLDTKRLLFIISDITGHGVSAALLVNRLHSEVERLIREEKKPGDLLKDLDTFVKSGFRGTGMYLSAFCGLLDYSNKTLLYSNYGHPPQILYQKRSASLNYLRPHTTFLGLQLEQEGTYEGSINFERGDRILLFTDGLIETKGRGSEDYGIERLEKITRLNRNRPPEVFCRNLIDDLNSFRVGDISDDIYLLAIDIK